MPNPFGRILFTRQRKDSGDDSTLGRAAAGEAEAAFDTDGEPVGVALAVWVAGLSEGEVKGETLGDEVGEEPVEDAEWPLAPWVPQAASKAAPAEPTAALRTVRRVMTLRRDEEW